LLFLPGNKLPDEKLFHIEHFDKIVHFILFLSLEWFLLFDGKVKKIIISVQLVTISTLLAIIFASFTEIIQHYFIADRIGSIYDLSADISGMVAGILLYRFFLDFINRFRYRRT
jgi:VanZ family protein